MKTPTYYLRKFRENPDSSVGVDMATNAILAIKKGSFTAEDRNKEEWKTIKSRIVAKYGLVLTVVEVINEIVTEMTYL